MSDTPPPVLRTLDDIIRDEVEQERKLAAKQLEAALTLVDPIIHVYKAFKKSVDVSDAIKLTEIVVRSILGDGSKSMTTCPSSANVCSGSDIGAIRG
jgi:hypothetical protein